MMCFRDMTFCPYSSKCWHGDTCKRAWTKDLQAEAEAWWGKPGAPVAFYDDKPDCFKEATND